jgi:hypothetical protein
MLLPMVSLVDLCWVSDLPPSSSGLLQSPSSLMLMYLAPSRCPDTFPLPVPYLPLPQWC